MRLIDADALYDKAEMWYKGARAPFREIYRSLVDAVADAPTIDPPPNDPLTLEDLRGMDGDPVWIAQEGDAGRWAIIAGVSINYMYTYGHGTLDTRCCGKHWWAYRRKPEDYE